MRKRHTNEPGRSEEIKSASFAMMCLKTRGTDRSGQSGKAETQAGYI